MAPGAELPNTQGELSGLQGSARAAPCPPGSPAACFQDFGHLLQHVLNFSKQIEGLQAAYCLNISSFYPPHKYRCSLSVEKIEKSAGVIFCPSQWNCFMTPGLPL